MCANINAHIHIFHTHRCEHAHVITSMHTHTYKRSSSFCEMICYMYVCMYEYLHICIHTYMHACHDACCAYAQCIHTYIHTHTHIDIQIGNNNSNTYTHTHIHIYIYLAQNQHRYCAPDLVDTLIHACIICLEMNTHI